mgnify:CR=1 FL=1
MTNIDTKLPLLSIIVPIYKVEEFLEECVESILKQEFKDYELILVDDGSPDNCGKICDNYAELDNRIKVIHKKNEGVSIARQIGVKHSKGLYSIHVDADDYIDKCEIERMMDIALKFNADMVVCDYILEYKKNKFVYQKGMKDACDAFDFLKQIYNGIFIGTLWNKLIKTSLYNNVIFLKQCNYCEDVYILTQILSNNISINYINEALYHYCYDASSLTREINRNYIINRIIFIQEIEKILPLDLDLSRFKAGIKLSILKSGEYTYKEYINLYPNTNIPKELLNKRNLLFLSTANFFIGYQFLKILFNLKKRFKSFHL